MRQVFVVGYMHSGTTLLQKIIGQHQSVLCIDGESKYFESLPIIKTQFPDLTNQSDLLKLIIFTINTIHHGFSASFDAKSLLNCSDLENKDVLAILGSLTHPITYCSVFRESYSYIAQNGSYNIWLEKTPTHVFYVQEIIECMPGALILEIIRDPRDILASKKTRRRTVWTARYKKQQQQQKHLEKAYDPVLDTISWKSFVRAGVTNRDLYTKNMLCIRYEDLTNKPENTIHEVCKFLGMEYVPAMLNVGAGIPSDTVQVRKKGISSQSNGRWKTILTKREVSICQQLVGSELEGFRYDIVKISPFYRLTAKFLYLMSISDLFKRVYRRWKLGGMPLLKKTMHGYMLRIKKML